MWFVAVRIGKSYVSFQPMPLYMSTTLEAQISPSLKKHMQGKTCFNFKTVPDSESIATLRKLITAAASDWKRFIK